MSPIQKFEILNPDCFIKREDLVGGLFNGIKQRKVASILEDIRVKKPKKILIQGSYQSNFLVAMVSALKSLAIPLEIYLNKKPHILTPKGNYFFLKTLVSSESFKTMDQFPHELMDDDYLIHEGGDQIAGYKGLLSLGDELIQQMEELQLFFDHIWIDAGTGSSASCLLYALSQAKKKPTVHIVSMHDEKQAFEEKKEEIFAMLNREFGRNSEDIPPYFFYRNKYAKSFGSTNQMIFNTIATVANKTGIFLDPIYSAKLFLTAEETNLQGTQLFIHSGGSLSLTGFFDQF